RALADAENTRRQAERRVEDTRKFAVADFAREVLIVLDNLERTIAAARSETKNSLEQASLIEGVRHAEREIAQVAPRPLSFPKIISAHSDDAGLRFIWRISVNSNIVSICTALCLISLSLSYPIEAS